MELSPWAVLKIQIECQTQVDSQQQQIIIIARCHQAVSTNQQFHLFHQITLVILIIIINEDFLNRIQQILITITITQMKIKP